ncbi:MAG: DUF2769 domain-containing protein [Candidatus Pacebacteria bacterium]|nr:DUF2769 domain-containing protein [Candidatus Paceibacterota bacterium]
MEENEDFQVPFNAENAGGCVCPTCPVQIRSECVKQKIKLESSETDPAKLYCSAGVSLCGDLDFSQSCICGTCPVWQKYSLVSKSPSLYFCRHGKAKQI